MVLLPDAANCIKTTLVGHNQGATWMNTVYFFSPTGLGTDAAIIAGLGTFNEAVGSMWNTHIAPLCSDEVVLVSVNSLVLTNRSSPQAYSTLPTARVGTRSGAALPTSVACVLSWRSALRYRGGHGRIYIPGGVAADVENGRAWTEAFRSLASTNAQAFHTGIDGLSLSTVPLTHITLSYFSGSHKTDADKHPEPVLRANPLPIPITQATVRGRVDTQRRRLGKETL